MDCGAAPVVKIGAGERAEVIGELESGFKGAANGLEWIHGEKNTFEAVDPDEDSNGLLCEIDAAPVIPAADISLSQIDNFTFHFFEKDNFTFH